MVPPVAAAFAEERREGDQGLKLMWAFEPVFDGAPDARRRIL